MTESIQEALERKKIRLKRLQKFNYRFKTKIEPDFEIYDDNDISDCFLRYISSKSHFFYHAMKILVSSIEEVFSIKYHFCLNEKIIRFPGCCLIKISRNNNGPLLMITLFKPINFFPDYLKSLLKLQEFKMDESRICRFECQDYDQFNHIFDSINYIIRGEDGYEECSNFEPKNY